MVSTKLKQIGEGKVIYNIRILISAIEVYRLDFLFCCNLCFLPCLLHLLLIKPN